MLRDNACCLQPERCGSICCGCTLDNGLGGIRIETLKAIAPHIQQIEMQIFHGTWQGFQYIAGHMQRAQLLHATYGEGQVTYPIVIQIERDQTLVFNQRRWKVTQFIGRQVQFAQRLTQLAATQPAPVVKLAQRVATQVQRGQRQSTQLVGNLQEKLYI